MNQLTNDLEVLAGLHERGDLSPDEFARAKAALLGTARPDNYRPQTSDTPSSVQLAQIARQNDLAQLDREWQMEREKYLVRGKYGTKSVPTETESVVVGISVVGFGVLWMTFAAGMGAPFFFPLFGMLFVLVGILGVFDSYRKARRYKAAEARYKQRRLELLGDHSQTFR